MNLKSFFNRPLSIKRKHYWGGAVAIVALTGIVGLQAHTQLQSLGTMTIDVPARIASCKTVEERVRTMSTDDINSLLIIVSETLTDNYREAKREEYENEMNRKLNHDAEIAAVTHLNDVTGVLVKSIGGMPTSTLAERN